MAGERLSFGDAADRYDRARPSYPPAAAAWLVGARPARVLELGAGTGKLTEQVVALGHEVFATDPDELAHSEPAVFLDLVQRLRTTEASAYTKRDTPTFTCLAMSVERALSSLDGAALAVEV